MLGIGARVQTTSDAQLTVASERVPARKPMDQLHDHSLVAEPHVGDFEVDDERESFV